MQNSSTLKLCECGCGEPTKPSAQTDRRDGYVKGQYRRFLPGHHLRLPRYKENIVIGKEWQKGSGNPAWKGGIIRLRGRKYVHRPEHPHANCKGYVAAHRLLMEEMIGRYLEPTEIVSFRDQNPENIVRNNLLLFACLSDFLSWRGGGNALPVRVG